MDGYVGRQAGRQGAGWMDGWIVEMFGRKRTGAAGSDKAMKYGKASPRTEEDWTQGRQPAGVSQVHKNIGLPTTCTGIKRTYNHTSNAQRMHAAGPRRVERKKGRKWISIYSESGDVML